MPPKQMMVMRGFAKHAYFELSASEAGDSDIQGMFDMGLVESYNAQGSIMWHLTRKGREELLRLGLARTADHLVMDAASGTLQRVP